MIRKSPAGYYEATTIRSVSLAPPAFRSYVVVAWALRLKTGDIETDYGASPVVAIQTKTLDHWDSLQERSVCPDPQQMDVLGWAFSHTSTSYEPIVHMGGFEYSEWDPVEDVDSVPKSPRELVTCTWPPEEDATRLAEVGAKLMAEAIRQKVEQLPPPLPGRLSSKPTP
jgi:hypothetical protein